MNGTKKMSKSTNNLNLNKHNRLIIRTHGGLGNQIFQVFFGLNMKTKEIILVHDSRYKHNFQLSKDFADYFRMKPELYEKLIIFSRGIKVIEKISNFKPMIKVCNTLYADGYFQKIEYYKSGTENNFVESIERLRSILKIKSSPKQNEISHIRLHDFYSTDVERLTVARERLSALKNYSSFITTDDLLIQDDHLCQKIIMERKLNHIDTSTLCAENVLRIMASYKIIKSNDSTLAFWAALLGDCDLIVKNKELQELFFYLQKSVRANSYSCTSLNF